MYKKEFYYCDKCNKQYNTEKEALLCEQYHVNVIEVNWKDSCDILVPKQVSITWEIKGEACKVYYKQEESTWEQPSYNHEASEFNLHMSVQRTDEFNALRENNDEKEIICDS